MHLPSITQNMDERIWQWVMTDLSHGADSSKVQAPFSAVTQKGISVCWCVFKLHHLFQREIFLRSFHVLP